MQSRRGLILMLSAGLAGILFVTGAVLADELLGTITKVDTDAKILTVVPKDSDKEVKIKVNDKTEQISKKGARKVDVAKLKERLEKVQDNGQKGISAKITHEDGVASKIEYAAKKKSE
ncbi:hypothetical protein [Aquisphaera insulae]|uniref:hypothetical protein n=1 Tax=Aquisphaera insulae TaxID=2712864 RepID=UPI0013EB60A4|nr:hypothetical protein [Aquisphaera insulae]